MSFGDFLENVTGTRLVEGTLSLMDPNVGFDPHYFNSGVWTPKDFPRDSLQFDTAPEGSASFFHLAERLRPTVLNMPPHTTKNILHCHPGGEFTYVIDGCFIDADIRGRKLRAYTQGQIVFYNKGSTHNPLSVDGARLLYLPLNGIVFGETPEDLIKKMVKVGTPTEALEYALLWMIPEKRERNALVEQLQSSLLTRLA